MDVYSRVSMVSSVNHLSTWYVHLHSGLPFTHLNKLNWGI